MNAAIELPIETLNSLRSALPHGAIKVITKKTGFSRTYVGMVLSGESKITPDNEKVIVEAQRIIEDMKDEAHKLNAKILKTLSK